jgi:hypothetical protein
MVNWKYSMGLVIIVLIVWITMVICLAIVYSILPPLEELELSGLAANMFQLIVAGFIVLAWLYSWNTLARYYFRRNLGIAKTKSPSVITGKRQERKMSGNRRANN